MKPVALLAAAIALLAVALIAFLLMPPGDSDPGGGAAAPGGSGAALTATPEGLESPERIAEDALVPVETDASSPSRSADAVADPGPWLEVVDPQGRPIPGAEIYWGDPFAELSSGEDLFANATITGAAGLDQVLLDRGERSVTNADGRWRLPEFSRALHVHARFEGATGLTTLRAEELQEVQRLELKPTARFEIHFVNSAGEPETVPQLVVDVRKRDDAAWRTSRGLSAFGSQGRFVLPLPALLNARSTADLGLAHPPGLFRPPGGYGFEIAAPPKEPVEWVVPPKALMVLRLEERASPGWRGLKAVRAAVDYEALGVLEDQPRLVPRVVPFAQIETTTRENAAPGDDDWLVFLGDVEVQTPLKIELEFESGAVLGPLSVSGPPVADETHVIAIADPGAAPEVGVRFEMRELGGLPMDRAELHVTLFDGRERRLAAPVVAGGRSTEDGVVLLESPWIFASSWPEELRATAWPAPFKLLVQADWQGRRWVAEQPLEIEGAQEPTTIDLGEVLFVPARTWLEGVVLDHRGQPVAGAELCVAPTTELDNSSAAWEFAMLTMSHGLDLQPDERMSAYTTKSGSDGRFQLRGEQPGQGIMIYAELRNQLTTPGGRTWTDLQKAGLNIEGTTSESIELRFDSRFAVHGRLEGPAERLSRVKLGLQLEQPSERTSNGRPVLDVMHSFTDNVQYDGESGEWCVWTSTETPLRIRAGVLGELGEQFSTEILEPVHNVDGGGLDLGVGQLLPPSPPPDEDD
ncbi:MAG: hypothetical protein ACYS26_16185 [Planctomycetota bacterium]|jgi:hypothetical protein